MLKLALVNPLQATTSMDTLQRGDEVHPPLIANPYQMDPARAAEYENGYQHAQKIGHLQLISVPPEQLLGESNGSVPWREGFAASARALGAGQVADTIEATIAPKTAGIAMDLTKLAYGYMQGLRYGAGIGAGLGLVKGLASGDSIGDVAKDTLHGAAAGGALGSISSPLVNKARGMFAPKVAPGAGAPLPTPPPMPQSTHEAPVEIPSNDVMPIQPRFGKNAAAPLAAPIAAKPHIDPLARMPSHFFEPGASLAPRVPPKAAPGSLHPSEVQHLLSQLPKAQPAQQPRFGVSMDPPMLGLSKIAFSKLALIRPVGMPGMTASFNRFAGQPAAKPKAAPMNIKPQMAPAAPPVAAAIAHPGGKQSVPVFDVMKPGMPEVGRKVAEAEGEKKPEGFFAALKDEVGKAKDSLIEGSKNKARGKDRLFRAAFGMKPREAKHAACGGSHDSRAANFYKNKIKNLADRRGETPETLGEGKTAEVIFAPFEKDAGVLGNVLGGAGIGALVPIAAGALGGAGLGAGVGAVGDMVGLDHLPLVGDAVNAGHGAVGGGVVGAGLGSTFAPMGAAAGSVAGAGKSVYDATKPKPPPAFATVN